MADLMSRTLSQVAPRDKFDRVTVLTGAGLSAAAGLGTFRGADGRWTLAPELERAMHAEYVPDNIQQLWTVWGGLRQRARQAGPTVGHRVLAKLAPTIITQNVDGLHTDAGSQGVIELHGSAARARCLSAQCGWTGPADDQVSAAQPPRCGRCGGLLRPDVVLFGEGIDEEQWRNAERAASECDLFLAVGTSASVAPAVWLAPIARGAGALCVNINIDPNADPNASFHESVLGDAHVVLAQWAA